MQAGLSDAWVLVYVKGNTPDYVTLSSLEIHSILGNIIKI